METLTQCPVCETGQFEPFLTCTDYLVSTEPFNIQQCKQCGFRFTNPRPEAEVVGKYYKSADYVSHNDTGAGLINSAYRLVRNYTLRTKLSLINKLHGKPGHILDVGCGTGAFLNTCKQGDWQVSGTEPDQDARAIAVQKLGNVIKPSLNELEIKPTFDIITMWHVLEHVSELNQTIDELKSLLTKNGSLVIAVPNSNSYDAQYFGQFWAAYDLPRHLYHFTPKTIESLFNKHGFRLVDKKPMLFDAFYIALLSTRYQSGTPNYVASVKIGVQSNSKAMRSGDYSSLIYVFQ
ncbi:Methyltransferase type 12 [Fibrisoma limi BUZ 3]|uniref:Methyltransferase type 12 n=1 Tax=Fibrisoma limi BUZ 3 TaxID=1185876 RepID=I2GRS5_9BACT|nr:class I SAM-dependent methyltransferase [Fibrisoma limi]CCH56603.1 Methyltransferase type 12 [Fibrisoma limi BUZ 3]